MKPEFITFTGIDDRTDLAKADKLADKYPIEWGVLFSATNQDARYPSMQAVNEIMGINGRKSAHLCGRIARDVADLKVDKFLPLDKVGRAQVNGYNVPKKNLKALEREYGIEVILQLRKHKEFGQDFCYLFDKSGGRGQTPDSVIVMQSKHKLVGYAGGICAENVLDYITMLSGTSNYWLDMEGKVRTEGWFDLDKVEAVCQKVFEY